MIDTQLSRNELSAIRAVSYKGKGKARSYADAGDLADATAWQIAVDYADKLLDGGEVEFDTVQRLIECGLQLEA